MDPRPRVALLDSEPSLGRHLDPAELAQARQRLTTPTVALSTGPCRIGSLRAVPAAQGRVIAVVMLDGVLTVDMVLDGRLCSQLLLAGDVLALDGIDTDALPTTITVQVVQAAHIALLDDRFLAACQRWPRLIAGLSERLAIQARRSHRGQAISQLPRVEDRVLGLLWSIADQHGRVHADGVHIDLPLTHAAIGNMIGARRPTVSLGIQKLADARLLRQAAGEWIIDPATLEHFAAGGADPTAQTVRSPRRPQPVAPADVELLIVTADPAGHTGPFAAIVVADETAALDELATTVPGVVLVELDGESPPRFGETLLAALRAEPGLAHVRLMVANRDGATPSPLLLSGAHDYVVDVADRAELAARIRSQLAIADAVRSQRLREAG